MKIHIKKHHLRKKLLLLEAKLMKELREIRQTRIDAPFNKGMLYLDSDVSAELRKVSDILHLLWLDEQAQYDMFDEYFLLEQGDLWMIMNYKDRIFPKPEVSITEEEA